MGERSFSKSWGLRASGSFCPLPLPRHCFFALVPTFLDELAQKRLLHRLGTSSQAHLFVMSLNVAKYHLGKVKMSANAASGLPHLQYVTFGVASRGFTGFQGSLLYMCSVIS